MGGRSSTIREAEFRALMQLAHETLELPPVQRARAAHIMAGLSQAIGASAAGFVQRGVAMGWDEPLEGDAVLLGFDAAGERIVRDYLRHPVPHDPMISHMLQVRQRVAARHRQAAYDDNTWYRHVHYREVRSRLGIDHAIYSHLTLPEGTRILITFHRPRGDRPFRERDAKLIELFYEAAWRAFRWNTPGSIRPQRDLPQRLRPVLDGLLAGEAPKRIAYRTGLSLHTVYEYVKQLYRHYGVTSRGELLSRFVTREAG